MKKCISFTTLAVALTLFYGCEKLGLNCVRGKGGYITVQYNSEKQPYHSIALKTTAVMNVYRDTVSPYLVSIKADNSIHDNLRVTLANDMLTVEAKECMRDYKQIQGTLWLDRVSSLTVEGDGFIRVWDPFEMDEARVTITGEGEIDFDQLRVDRLTSTVDGNGEVRLDGSAGEHQITSFNGGRCKAFGLNTGVTRIHLEGNGVLEVHAADTLEVYITGGGTVYYKGQPVILQQIDGGGSLIDAN